jgi:hypothetical protein
MKGTSDSVHGTAKNQQFVSELRKEKIIDPLINFIILLSTGAVIGLITSRIVKVEHRRSPKPLSGEWDRSSEES